MYLHTLTATLSIMSSQINNNHQERVRLGQAQTCNICDDTFPSARALRNHRRYCTIDSPASLATAQDIDVEMEEMPDYMETGMDIDIDGIPHQSENG